MAINTDSLQSRLDNWLQLITPFYSSDVKNEQDLIECLVKSILSLFKTLKTHSVLIYRSANRPSALSVSCVHSFHIFYIETALKSNVHFFFPLKGLIRWFVCYVK